MMARFSLTSFKITAVGALVVLLIGCGPTAPEPPDEASMATGMANVLIDTGLFREVSITKIVGLHFVPAENKFRILGCYRFTTADGRQGQNCIDSYELMMLENGRWIVTVTLNNVYRWRAVFEDFAPDTADAAESESP